MTDDTAPTVAPYGERGPGLFDRTVIAITGGLPRNWLGLRLAIGLRRLVTMRLPDDAGLDVERWGLRLRLHPLHNGCEKGLLFTPQFYEAGEREALDRRIAQAVAADRPFVFVDIGANVGLFSLFVAARAGRNARILAVEPERENLRRLRFNIEANAGLPIEVLAHALGDSDVSVALEIDRNDRGGTRTRPLQDADRAGVSVACRTLVQVLAQQNVTSIDALKIDVEGSEPAILLPFFQAAPESLWPRFLIVEDTSDVWPVDLFSEIRARGYKVSARTRLNVMMER